MTRRPYPDYGSPGAPNMDPYYMTPEERAQCLAEHDAADVAVIVMEAETAIAAALEYAETQMQKIGDGHMIAAVRVDADNFAVEIDTKEGRT